MSNKKLCKNRSCNIEFDIEFLAKNTKDSTFRKCKEYAKTKFEERLFCSKKCQVKELGLTKLNESMRKWDNVDTICVICQKEKPLKYSKCKTKIRWTDSYKAQTCGNKICDYLRFVSKDDDFGYKHNEVNLLYKKLQNNFEFEKFKNIRLKLANIRCRKRAKEFGFNLTIKYLFNIFPNDMMCPVYNVPMLFESNFSNAFKASVDRKDSSKGYIKGNIIWVSNKANIYKNAMDFYDVKKIYQFMTKLNLENKYPELLDLKPIVVLLD